MTDDVFLHDQKGDAVDTRYSIQTAAGGVLFLFNESGITAREVFETFRAGREIRLPHGHFVAQSIVDWWDDLPASLRQDIEGSGKEPGCIARARRFIKNSSLTSGDRGNDQRSQSKPQSGYCRSARG